MPRHLLPGLLAALLIAAAPASLLPGPAAAQTLRMRDLLAEGYRIVAAVQDRNDYTLILQNDDRVFGCVFDLFGQFRQCIEFQS